MFMPSVMGHLGVSVPGFTNPVNVAWWERFDPARPRTNAITFWGQWIIGYYAYATVRRDFRSVAR